MFIFRFLFLCIEVNKKDFNHYKTLEILTLDKKRFHQRKTVSIVIDILSAQFDVIC